MATIELIDNYYTCLPREYLGSTSVASAEPNEYMKHNAGQITAFFRNYGWSDNAIAGMLGNMQVESNALNPACIQTGYSTYIPDNDQMEFYGFVDGVYKSGHAVGLVQWDGANDQKQHKLIGYAIRQGIPWYYGRLQCMRIRGEQENNLQFTTVTIGGVKYNWDTYPTATASPSNLAYAWDAGYEKSSGTSREIRQANAEWWYLYIQGKVFTTVPIWLLMKMKGEQKKHGRRTIQL